MKLAAASAKILEVKRSKLGLYNVLAEIDNEIYDFSIISLNGESIVISSSIIDALIANKVDLAYELSALFSSVYSLNKTEIEDMAREA